MSKTYVTFAQRHAHSVNGKTFDKDCVAVIECSSKNEGREKAFQYFESKFYSEYFEDEFNYNNLKYFPRGLIGVNCKLN